MVIMVIIQLAETIDCIYNLYIIIGQFQFFLDRQKTFCLNNCPTFNTNYKIFSPQKKNQEQIWAI